MQIRILTITHKSPSWLREAYAEYAKRIPPSYTLELIEIPAEKRFPSSDPKRLLEKEAKKMLAHLNPDDYVIALEVTGKKWSTEELAEQLQKWQHLGKTVNLLIGGPDGLAPICLERANLKWSLSPLTFPHFFVRLILAEQLYRAISILQNHPYHR